MQVSGFLLGLCNVILSPGPKSWQWMGLKELEGGSSDCSQEKLTHKGMVPLLSSTNQLWGTCAVFGPPLPQCRVLPLHLEYKNSFSSWPRLNGGYETLFDLKTQHCQLQNVFKRDSKKYCLRFLFCHTSLPLTCLPTICYYCQLPLQSTHHKPFPCSAGPTREGAVPVEQ